MTKHPVRIIGFDPGTPEGDRIAAVEVSYQDGKLTVEQMRADPVAFAQHVTGEKLHPWQEEVLRNMQMQSRQLGKTRMTAKFQDWLAGAEWVADEAPDASPYWRNTNPPDYVDGTCVDLDAAPKRLEDKKNPA